MESSERWARHLSHIGDRRETAGIERVGHRLDLRGVDQAAGALGHERRIDAEIGDDNRVVPPKRCLAMLLQLLDAMVVVVTSEESGAWAHLILKEQQDPSEGFDVLYSGFMSRLIGTTARLAGRIRQLESDSEAANLLAFTLIGQVLVFRTGRAAVERRTGWKTFTQREISAVQTHIHRNVTAILLQENFE